MFALQKRLNLRKNKQFHSCPILWIWFLLLSIFGGALMVFIIFSLPSSSFSTGSSLLESTTTTKLSAAENVDLQNANIIRSPHKTNDNQGDSYPQQNLKMNEQQDKMITSSIYDEYFREKQQFRMESLVENNKNFMKRKRSDSILKSDEQNVWTTDRFHAAQVVDEVIYSLQSRQDSPSCNARMVKEVFASALSMREMCPWCNTFAISLVVDDPIYSFLVSDEHREQTLFVFDRVQRVTISLETKPRLNRIFASRKASDLLNHAVKPFVIFMDTDVYSSHREFPNAIFNMLHKDKDLILPVDWAHRHGHLFGRGVPGLCTCLIGFVNTPSVTRVFRLWDEYMAMADPIQFNDEQDEQQQQQQQQQLRQQSQQQEDESKIYQPKPNESNEERLARWKQILRRTSGTIYQIRDQEIFSLVLHENAFPDVNLFALSIEWVCPITNHIHSQWSEGIVVPGKQVHYLTQNPCKSVHSHPSPTNAFKTFKYREWMEGLDVITGYHPRITEEVHKCGGAFRLRDLSSSN